MYEVTNQDAEAILKGTGESQDGVVRIRGLPFNCAEKEIIQFFSGVNITQYTSPTDPIHCNPSHFLKSTLSGLSVMKDGVTLVMDRWGRSSGDAFVQFATQEMADEALKRDRDVIGNRSDHYVELKCANCVKLETKLWCATLLK